MPTSPSCPSVPAHKRCLAAVTKLASMFNPVGAIVQAIISRAANRIEKKLANLVPVAIALLARLIQRYWLAGAERAARRYPGR